MKLGIDIGRVLIAADGSADTSFIGGSIADALATPPYEGMFEAVPQLAELFGHQVWLVSKARPRTQEKTRLWLAHHRFFELTGIDSSHLRFCLERPQKADHCRQLGLQYFVDDRLDVLQHLAGLVPHRYLFGPQTPGLVIPPGVTPVKDWAQAREAIAKQVATVIH